MSTKGKMSTSRKIAIIVGVLYLTANILGPIALQLEGPILDAPDFPASVAASENRWKIGVLLGSVYSVALAGIGLMIYPVLRQRDERIAIGYVGARVIEGVLWLVAQTSLLSLVTLSQEFVKAGAPDASHFHTLGEMSLAAHDWGGHVLGFLVFCVGALMFYPLLYRSRLIPRWLSGWGIIAAMLALVAALLALFGLETNSTIDVLLQVPLFGNELVLALWLIVKGFNPSAIASES
jgi:hypothetical protein